MLLATGVVEVPRTSRHVLACGRRVSLWKLCIFLSADYANEDARGSSEESSVRLTGILPRARSFSVVLESLPAAYITKPMPDPEKAV